MSCPQLAEECAKAISLNDTWVKGNIISGAKWSCRWPTFYENIKSWSPNPPATGRDWSFPGTREKITLSSTQYQVRCSSDNVDHWILASMRLDSMWLARISLHAKRPIIRSRHATRRRLVAWPEVKSEKRYPKLCAFCDIHKPMSSTAAYERIEMDTMGRCDSP